MINSNWMDPYHHVKQDPLRMKKKDTRHNGHDITDMVFIGPDVDAISSTRNGGITRTPPTFYLTD